MPLMKTLIELSILMEASSAPRRLLISLMNESEAVKIVKQAVGKNLKRVHLASLILKFIIRLNDVVQSVQGTIKFLFKLEML